MSVQKTKVAVFKGKSLIRTKIIIDNNIDTDTDITGEHAVA
jgi:hypothetical protein